MIIKSAFKSNQEIPLAYTCLGANVNPPLYFEDIPEQAESLVLFLEDIDASPAPWIHWHVFNIPPSTLYVAERSIPPGGTEGLCNNHTFGYEGPCPRYFKGAHHYWFRLYALDTVLDLAPDSEPGEVKKQMEGHVIATAELPGLCTAPV
ncbi:YbhB/YbcL family Raf kinase inhibitor-like protein [Pedobacter sp. BS3]|uniref:YbhB/YbcL family Raf kinase inhibitor-like protein n=1 Tax=Pedobacter sp. BS3 TaxID=2567937 RepID=UPI0011EDD7A3|nr:YbhB/YbcL family Raf kinase inhibitor-like protein [Pedobacter sp. BS3]TZF82606.1 YbhB/YbcL family Raf kinase inhibitor-like protein [Pedobacter sp. BS3]